MSRRRFWSFFCFVLSGFLLWSAAPVQARRNPDPLAILKSLPPPTVEYGWEQASATPTLPKPALNPPGPKPASKTLFIRIPPTNGSGARVLPALAQALGEKPATLSTSLGSKPVSLSSLPIQTAKASAVANIGSASSLPPKRVTPTASSTLKAVGSASPLKPEAQVDPKTGKAIIAEEPKGTGSTKPPATATAAIVASPTITASPMGDKKPVTGTGTPAIVTILTASGTTPPETGSSSATVANATASEATTPDPADGEDGEAAGEEDKPPAGPPPEILAKAEDYLKQAKWKELDTVYRDTPNLVEDQRGAQIRIECLVNQPKINYLEIKRVAEMALGKDAKDPYGNLGMGVYFSESKKPDSAKALKHLSLAAAAKKPPAGVSGRLWKARAKAYWLYLLLVLGGIGAGIDKRRKKRQAAAAPVLGPDGLPLPGETPGQASPEPEIEEPPPADGAAAPTGFLDKIKGLLSRLRRKPASAAENEASIAALPTAAGSAAPEQTADASASSSPSAGSSGESNAAAGDAGTPPPAAGNA